MVPPEADSAWGSLERHLQWAQGPWFAFAFGSEARLDRLRQLAADAVVAAGGTPHLLAPTTPQALREVVAQLAHGTASPLVWVQATLDGPPWVEAWDDVMLRANERREILKRQLGGGIVFAAAPTLKPRFREAAPDLWSVRSLVLEPEPDPSDEAAPHHPDPRAARSNNWRLAEAALRVGFHLRLQRAPWFALVLGDDPAPRRRLLDTLTERWRVAVHQTFTPALELPTDAQLHWLELTDDPPLGLLQAMQAGTISAPLILEGSAPAEASLLRVPSLADARAFTVRLYVERALHPGPLPTLDKERQELQQAWHRLAHARELEADLVKLQGDEARDAQRARLEALSQAAEALVVQGWAAEAAPVVEELRALCDTVGAARPGEPAVDMWKASACELASRVSRALGDLEGARERQTEALELRHALATADGTLWPQGRSEWARASSIAGELALQAADLDAAAPLLSQALHVRQALLDWSDDHETRSELATSWSLLGDLELTRCDAGQDRLDAARDAFDEARRLRQIVADDTGQLRHRRLLSVSWGRSGTVRSRGGATRGARDAFRRAAELARALVLEEPGRPNLRMEASVADSRVGDAARSSGDWAAAREAYRAVVEQRRQLVAHDPENARWQQLLAIAIGRLAEAHLAQHDLSEAAACAREAVELLEQLVWMDPAHPAWQRALAMAWIRRGDVASARATPDRADRYWRRAHGVADTLEALPGADARRRADEIRAVLAQRVTARDAP